MHRIIQALGIQLVPVEGLADEVALIDDLGVALIRPDLDGPARDRALDWLIQAAATGTAHV